MIKGNQKKNVQIFEGRLLFSLRFSSIRHWVRSLAEHPVLFVQTKLCSHTRPNTPITTSSTCWITQILRIGMHRWRWSTGPPAIGAPSTGATDPPAPPIHRCTFHRCHRSIGPPSTYATDPLVHRAPVPPIHRSTGHRCHRSTGPPATGLTGPSVAPVNSLETYGDDRFISTAGFF